MPAGRRPGASPGGGTRRFRTCGAGAATPFPECALLDPEELDLEDEGRVRPDLAPRPALAVGEVRRDEELPLVAHLHELERLGPPGDDALDRERRRLAALVGTVELRPVDQRAAVIRLHGVGRLRRGAVTRLDHLVLEAARQRLDPVLLRVLREEGLSLLLVLLARRLH